MKKFRDELDAANEKAERADRLEQEITRYKEKLSGVDFFKSRVKELSEDNQHLIENKQILDEQLHTYKLKAGQVTELEQQIFQLKQQLEELSLENATSRERYRELSEEKAQLEQLVKASTKETLENGFIIDSDDSSIAMDNSLIEQLNTSAQSQAIKLELENRRLSSLLDSIKENSIHEESTKLVNVQKENKKLSTMYHDMREQMRKLVRKHELLQDKYNKLVMASNEFSGLETKYQLVCREKQRLTALLDSVQRRSFDLERSLLDEKKLVKDELKESQIISKKELELDKLRELLKEHEEKLQKLSVDNSLTDSQKELSIANKQLTAEKEILLKSREKLSGDMDHLKSLHDQLNVDYQQLLQDRNKLRTRQREDTLKLRRQAESIENLETRIKLLEEECTSFKSDKVRVEHAKLMDDFSRLFKANETLLMDYKRAMNELNKRLSQEPELRSKSQKIVELELELSKIQHRVDVLEQINLALEQDKRSLMQHNTQLFEQNRQLVTQTREDREHYHEEERKNIDQVNNLRRQKEKLEEKIMDQYRRQEPTSAKKKSSRSIMKETFVRVSRAGSEFFLNRNRRSFAEESRRADEPSFDFEFTRGHESDDPATRPASRESTVSAYADCNYPRNRKSVDFLENFEPGDFSFGAELQARTRKSLDFAELCSLYKNEDEEGLDKTLHDSGNAEHIMASMLENDDCSTFGKNKSVDLSFEKDQTEEFDVSQENNNVEMRELMTANSRQSIWLDHGCV